MARKNLLRENKVLILILAYIGLDTLSRLPYLNLYLRPFITFLLLWILVLFLYKPSYKWTFFVIFISFLLSIGTFLISRGMLAEEIGIFAYILLIIGTIQFLLMSLKTLSKK